MPYLKPLITLGFWFGLNPAPFIAPVFVGLGVFLLALLVAGIIVKALGVKARKNPPLHRVYSRVGRISLTVSIIGLILFFFSYEQISLVSARFWWGLLAVGTIVWVVLAARDMRKKYPAEKKLLADRLAREKYLPK